MVPPANATTELSRSDPENRDCTRRVVHVVRYLSVKGRHSARQRMQANLLMISPDSN